MKKTYSKPAINAQPLTAAASLMSLSQGEDVENAVANSAAHRGQWGNLWSDTDE